jgi:hypothetical protein
LREEHRLRVFENRELRRIFGPKREEDGSWRKLHNDELHGLYSSLNIVRNQIKEDEVGRTCGTHGGGERCLQRSCWEARDHLEDLGVGGRITLKWALGRQGSMERTGFRWLKIGPSVGFL